MWSESRRRALALAIFADFIGRHLAIGCRRKEREKCLKIATSVGLFFEQNHVSHAVDWGVDHQSLNQLGGMRVLMLPVLRRCITYITRNTRPESGPCMQHWSGLHFTAAKSQFPLQNNAAAPSPGWPFL